MTAAAEMLKTTEAAVVSDVTLRDVNRAIDEGILLEGMFSVDDGRHVAPAGQRPSQGCSRRRPAHGEAQNGRMKFLVDECLNPELTKIAQAKGTGNPPMSSGLAAAAPMIGS